MLHYSTKRDKMIVKNPLLLVKSNHGRQERRSTVRPEGGGVQMPLVHTVKVAVIFVPYLKRALCEQVLCVRIRIFPKQDLYKGSIKQKGRLCKRPFLSLAPFGAFFLLRGRYHP